MLFAVIKIQGHFAECSNTRTKFGNLFWENYRSKEFRVCENSKNSDVLEEVKDDDCYHCFLDVVFYKHDNRVKSTKNLQRFILQIWVKACAHKILDKLSNIGNHSPGMLKSNLCRTL